MSTLRRQHLFPAAVLAVSAALVGVGCSSGGDTGPGTDTTVAADDLALEGVRFDVRRDPG